MSDNVQRGSTVEHPKERPIKFNEEMLGALLDGKKTVTRRLIKPQPDTTEEHLRKHDAWIEGLTLSDHVNGAWRAGFVDVDCPYGEPGDHLVVQTPGDLRAGLEITDVRIEQLQMITIGQICKEGLAQSMYEFIPVTTAFGAFEDLWDSIYGSGAWATNPWVWVIEFKRIAPPIQSSR